MGLYHKSFCLVFSRDITLLGGIYLILETPLPFLDYRYLDYQWNNSISMHKFFSCCYGHAKNSICCRSMQILIGVHTASVHLRSASVHLRSESYVRVYMMRLKFYPCMYVHVCTIHIRTYVHVHAFVCMRVYVLGFSGRPIDLLSCSMH